MSIYDYSVTTISGEEQTLAEYKDNVLLIVNTASKCGFTPQFEGLEQLYVKYQDRGLYVLGFPCNQFANQDPGSNEEIESFCQENYGVTFPMFSKIDVKGDHAHPLFKHLTSSSAGLVTDGIKWNFTKFLIDQQGNVVERFAPQTKPERISEKIEEFLEDL